MTSLAKKKHAQACVYCINEGNVSSLLWAFYNRMLQLYLQTFCWDKL